MYNHPSLKKREERISSRLEIETSSTKFLLGEDLGKEEKKSESSRKQTAHGED